MRLASHLRVAPLNVWLRGGRSIATLTPLPTFAEARKSGREDLVFRRVVLGDSNVATEVRAARALAAQRGLTLCCCPRTGLLQLPLPDGAPSWQLRPPPALAARILQGVADSSFIGRLAAGDSSLPGPAVVLLVAAGRAALGVLRDPPDLSGGGRRLRTDGLLAEHKVITTYAVRGSEKSGTGRFQLFEDDRNGKKKSEGAKLRRQCAIRFFEKINEKLSEWLPNGGGRDVFAVFFAGDPRLKKLLLECRKPKCPLPVEPRWIPLGGRYAQAKPSLEALELTARHLLTGEVAELPTGEDVAPATPPTV